MFRRLTYCILSALALLMAVSSCGGDRVLSKREMINLLKEMYMADQWIKDNSPRQRSADTSFVYRPILAKHGYTEADFRRSVSYYCDKPAEFGKIFNLVAEELRKSKADIDLREKQQRYRDSLKRAIEESPFRRPDFIEFIHPDYYVRDVLVYYDDDGTPRFRPNPAL